MGVTCACKYFPDRTLTANAHTEFHRQTASCCLGLLELIMSVKGLSLVAILFTSGFSYAQGPPQMPAEIIAPDPSVTVIPQRPDESTTIPAGSVPAANPANAMGAAPSTNLRLETRVRVPVVEVPTAGLARYADGYSP